MYKKIMEIDLTNKTSKVYSDEALFDEFMGGTGVATELLHKHCDPKADPLSAENPIIFAIGPFSNIYPVSTKTVAMFKSPLTGELGESHAGGRLAMAMYNAGLNAIVLKGKLDFKGYISIEDDKVEFHRAGTIWGKSSLATERILREAEKDREGKASIVRIGPAGERMSWYSAVTVDTQRHFGRLGLGAVFGSKNLKALVVRGTRYETIQDFKKFKTVYDKIYKAVVESGEMKKYHDLGTPVNVVPLSKIGGLPTRNFSQGYFENAEEISGEAFAEKHLIQQIACAHCQCGCIHIGMLREEFSQGKDHMYKTFKVSYDHELIFSLGSNLSIKSPEQILRFLHIVEKQGWDAITVGVVLSWATDAYIHGIIGDKETGGLALHFGDDKAYLEALRRMRDHYNEFYRDLEKGADFCANKYGGKDLAMVFGKNEAPGYITGENAFLDWMAVGVRHSHLDSAGYSLDQKLLVEDIPLEKQMAKLVEESKFRMLLNSLVICLFARNIYKTDIILEGLSALGIDWDLERINKFCDKVYKRKFEFKFACGFDIDQLELPGKLYRVKTASGKLDPDRVKERLRLFREIAGV